MTRGSYGIAAILVLLFFMFVASHCRASAICDHTVWYSNGDTSAATGAWVVGSPKGSLTQVYNTFDNRADREEFSCSVSGPELQFIQKNFTGLKGYKHQGVIFYVGDDAKFLMLNL